MYQNNTVYNLNLHSIIMSTLSEEEREGKGREGKTRKEEKEEKRKEERIKLMAER